MKFEKMYGKPIVCFTYEEMMDLTKDYQAKAFLDQMQKEGVTLSDLKQALLNRDKRIMDKVINPVAKTLSTSAFMHEFFVSWNIMLPFYEECSEVCFELGKNYIPGKAKIESVYDLKSLAEDIFSDFIVKSKDGYRLIQLKRYTKDIDEDILCKFIEDKLDEYGELGETNLVVLLQGPKDRRGSLQEIPENLLLNVSKKLCAQNLPINSEILLVFNENNARTVIVRLYPSYGVKYISTSWASGSSPESLD